MTCLSRQNANMTLTVVICSPTRTTPYRGTEIHVRGTEVQWRVVKDTSVHHPGRADWMWSQRNMRQDALRPQNSELGCYQGDPEDRVPSAAAWVVRGWHVARGHATMYRVGAAENNSDDDFSTTSDVFGTFIWTCQDVFWCALTLVWNAICSTLSHAQWLILCC